MQDYLVGGVIRTGDNSRLFSEKSPHHISRLDKTVPKFPVANSLDLSPVLFTPPTQTRENKGQSYLVWRCELGIIVEHKVAHFYLRPGLFAVDRH